MKYLIVLVWFASMDRTAALDIELNGYIITNDGDTVRGRIILEGSKPERYNLLNIYKMIKFTDSIGKTPAAYTPAQIAGYGFAWEGDSCTEHFRSFSQIEMTASFGTKNEDAFLNRKLTGAIEVYQVYHKNDAFVQISWLPDLYLLPVSDTSRHGRPDLLRIYYIDSGKKTVMYKREVLIPYLQGWPREKIDEIKKKVTTLDVYLIINAYNEWQKAESKNKL